MRFKRERAKPLPVPATRLTESGRLRVARTEISWRRQRLKQNRAQATFRRNICDAKVTLGEMPTNCTERPRISRIPATNQGLFDQRLTSCSPTIHASTL